MARRKIRSAAPAISGLWCRKGLELSHLRVFVAHPEYLLAMKCAAMRLGAEFLDLDDVRYLLRWLNITDLDAASAIVTRYFDETKVQPKTRLVLEEMLQK